MKPISPVEALERIGLTGQAALVPREIVTDLRDCQLKANERELREGRAFQIIRLALQRRRMQLAGQVLFQAHIDGIGRLKARILPEDAAELRTKYGPGCLHDREFLDDTIKRNPYMRPNCGPGRTTLLVQGRRGQRTEDKGQNGGSPHLNPLPDGEEGDRRRASGANVGHGAQGEPATPQLGSGHGTADVRSRRLEPSTSAR